MSLFAGDVDVPAPMIMMSYSDSSDSIICKELRRIPGLSKKYHLLSHLFVWMRITDDKCPTTVGRTRATCDAWYCAAVNEKPTLWYNPFPVQGN
jgi:hypothetical protein